MSDFSPLNIFKSQAKQLARDQGLKLSVAQETLVQKRASLITMSFLSSPNGTSRIRV